MRNLTWITPVAGALLALGPATVAAAASPTPTPASSPSASASASGSSAPVTTSGNSFLTATALAAGQDASVDASTGDYLYWAFPAAEGQTPTATLTVTLPAAADRHGPQTWTAEVFDGLRRRQACTAGTQSATAAPTATSLTVSCTLRQIRLGRALVGRPAAGNVLRQAVAGRCAGAGPRPAGHRAAAHRQHRRRGRRPAGGRLAEGGAGPAGERGGHPGTGRDGRAEPVPQRHNQRR